MFILGLFTFIVVIVVVVVVWLVQVDLVQGWNKIDLSRARAW